jgi:hypothetical protein
MLRLASLCQIKAKSESYVLWPLQEDGTLKALERELKLPSLESVYKDVSATLSSLLAADARRQSELQSLSQEGHSCQRMVFGEGEEYEDADYDDEDEEGQRYEYEEYEYEEYDDDAAYEEEGFEEENAGTGNAGANAGASKGGRKVANVMVLSSSGRQQSPDNAPAPSDNNRAAAENNRAAALGESRDKADKASAEARALRLLQSDEEALVGIQDLHAVRPVTHEGQGIDRGVKGKVQDNTRPLMEDDAEEKELKEAEAAYGHTIGSSYGRDMKEGTPHWTDAYWEVQRNDSKRKIGTPGTPGDVSASSAATMYGPLSPPSAVAGAEEKAEEKGQEPQGAKEGERKEGEKGGPLSPSGALSVSGGMSASGGLALSTSKADSLGGDSFKDSLEISLQRHSVLTRGAKLGDRNVLIRVYMAPGEEGGIEVSAFDPSSQETYTRVLTGPEAKRLLSKRGEELSEELVKQAGPDIVAALHLTEPQHGQGPALEVRLPTE